MKKIMMGCYFFSGLRGCTHRSSSCSQDYQEREMVGNVQVQGIYDNIGKTDTLGFAPKLHG